MSNLPYVVQLKLGLLSTLIELDSLFALLSAALLKDELMRLCAFLVVSLPPFLLWKLQPK